MLQFSSHIPRFSAYQKPIYKYLQKLYISQNSETTKGKWISSSTYTQWNVIHHTNEQDVERNIYALAK